MKENLVRDKSYRFSLSIIALYKGLVKAHEYVMSRQVLRSGRADFLSKMSIASKEARETHYWLRLLRDSQTIPSDQIAPLLTESESLINILTSIVKTTSYRK
jgi:hypothetical protein